MPCLLSLIRLVSMMLFNFKETSTNDTDYSCHMKAVELVYPIILDPYTSLVINSLRGGDTYTHPYTRTHTNTHTTHTHAD